MTQAEMRGISRVLADPRRFEILKKIAEQDRAACVDLRAKFPITAPTLSHHLKELESCGLIEVERIGKFMNITFRRPVWEAYLEKLGSI